MSKGSVNRTKSRQRRFHCNTINESRETPESTSWASLIRSTAGSQEKKMRDGSGVISSLPVCCLRSKRGKKTRSFTSEKARRRASEMASVVTAATREEMMAVTIALEDAILRSPERSRIKQRLGNPERGKTTFLRTQLPQAPPSPRH